MDLRYTNEQESKKRLILGFGHASGKTFGQ